MVALGQAGLDDETLGNEAELELVGQLRVELRSELDGLKAKRCDFEHVVGDIFMTRVVRGNDRDLASSAKWYRQFLAMREEHGLDEIYKRCEADKLPWRVDCIPHAEEVSKHFTTLFDEDRLRTPCGHLVWFDFFGDVSPALLQDEEKLKEFFRFATELRMSALDRLSRKQGRLVKVVRIMDTKGLAPWSVNLDMIAFFRGFVFQLSQSTSIETLHRFYCINASWFIVKLTNLFKPMMQERAKRRLHILDTAGMQDAKFLAVVPGGLLSEMQCKRRSDVEDGTALEGTSRVVDAGTSMTRSIPVVAGQRVSWEFCIGSSTGGTSASRSSLAWNVLDKAIGEATDVEFTVGFWADASSGNTADAEALFNHKPLVPAQVVDVATGPVSGSATAPAAGTVCLEWSNKASWVRPKMVASYKVSAH